MSEPLSGYTVADFARRYRVGTGKVRGWIDRGELRAINTAALACGRPRWVIPVDSIEEFERRRAAAPPPKPKPARRKRKPPGWVSYYGEAS